MAEPKFYPYETYTIQFIKNISATKHVLGEPNWFVMRIKYAAINTLNKITSQTHGPIIFSRIFAECAEVTGITVQPTFAQADGCSAKARAGRSLSKGRRISGQGVIVIRL